MTKDSPNIVIKEAETHNLKKINLEINRDKYVVISGVSGSGKSSLAFDTLFAEGQRRYIESLSAYARQFLGKMEKPKVKSIEGLAPSIAIQQKTSTYNKRSTVGTSTEIFDYLKILFTRVGKTYSPLTGKEVKKDTVESVVTTINKKKEGEKFIILAPVSPPETTGKFLQTIVKQGYTRIFFENEILLIEELNKKKIAKINQFKIVIDRLIVKKNNTDFDSRLYNSIETAFFESKGNCEVLFLKNTHPIETLCFNNRFELDGITYEEPSLALFSFNSSIGACEKCNGYGSTIDIDHQLVIPNKNLSVYEDAIACWKSEKMQTWKNTIVNTANKSKFPIHKPIKDLQEKDYKILWEGSKHFKGLNSFFDFLQKESYKIQYRVMLSRYRGLTGCNRCKGSRLKAATKNIKINNQSIHDLVLLPIDEFSKFFRTIKLTSLEQKISKMLLIEINSRVDYLERVGLGYLSLARDSSSLSGGETQRINLATSLGSTLVGSIYILDEPSIGLHSKDSEKLISTFKDLQKKGNTVIVVEHDEDVIKSADHIIDVGPLAGKEGGEITFEGTYKTLLDTKKSLTGLYLSGKKSILVPKKRKPWKRFIELKGANKNNLKNISVKFPLNIFTVITGVSGSGKSSLIKKCLLPLLSKSFEETINFSEKTASLQGNISDLKGVEFVNQHPIGKSSRSNPVTYLKAYDDIRNLFAKQDLAKQRNYKASHFSFNSGIGRCGKCKGEGELTIDMQFMADVHIICDSCEGSRFEATTLEILVNNKNVSQILNLTVDEAIAFFNEVKGLYPKKIIQKLSALQEVGLGYVTLGQPSSSLSGGEAQRVKLANFLIKKEADKLLFIFDEPTTGLHFDDIKKLLKSFYALLEKGHSLIVIEHHLDIIKCADWIIDIGPEAGKKGGEVLFEGTPEKIIKNKKSYTGIYLKEKLN